MVPAVQWRWTGEQGETVAKVRLSKPIVPEVCVSSTLWIPGWLSASVRPPAMSGTVSEPSWVPSTAKIFIVAVPAFAFLSPRTLTKSVVAGSAGLAGSTKVL